MQVVPDRLDFNEVKKNDSLFVLFIKKRLIFFCFYLGTIPIFGIVPK